MQFDFQKGSRTRILAISILGIMAIFALRLFYLQIIQHETYVELARSEQLKQFEITPARGELYALDGGEPVKLVMNEKVFTVWADPKVVTDVDEVIAVVKEYAGGNMRSGLESKLNNKSSRYQILATKVTRKQAELIKKKKLAGIGFDTGSQRVYPEGQLAAQVVGFVNADGEGKYGVEQALDSRLKGKKGMLQTVTDVRDVPLTIGKDNIRKPAVNGDNVVLSIDRNVQSAAERALAHALERTGAKQGSVIIMNPNDGRVMAMANLPTFRPAEYFKVEDAAAFNNATITMPYEVGSVAKTFTVATALDKQIITPESTYNNTDYIRVEDRTIENASKGKRMGNVTMQTALDWSLNTGMVTIAQRLGNGSQITPGARATIYDYLYNKYQLGQRTGIELAGEAAGIIIPPTEHEGNAVRYSNMTFGQGMDLTMIQTAAAFSAIINGGTYYAPSVVAGVVRDDGTFQAEKPRETKSGVISPTASAQAREMIHKAHQATYVPQDPPGYYFGGKTGTSQTIDPRTGKYTFNETIGTYLGFGGNSSEKPAFVIMTEISGKGMTLGGGGEAKPIFNELSKYMVDYLRLSPSA